MGGDDKDDSNDEGGGSMDDVKLQVEGSDAPEPMETAADSSSSFGSRIRSKFHHKKRSFDSSGGADASGHTGRSFLVENLEPKYHDVPSDMTYGRRIARCLSTKGWYNPHAKAREEYDTQHQPQEGAEEGEGKEEDAEEKETADAAKGGEKDDENEAFADSLVPAGIAAPVRPPSLDAAWAYFEHITLPRYFAHNHGLGMSTARGIDPTSRAARASVRVRAEAYKKHTTLYGRTIGQLSPKRRKERKGMDLLERAEPGESVEKTSLYSIFKTPEADLADFGVGVGLYFNSLRVLGLIALGAGLLNIPVIEFYQSEKYAASGQAETSKADLRGSAVCPDTKWMACPTCTRAMWDTFPRAFDRYATTERNGEVLHFILENRCNVDATVGMWSFIAFIFVIVSIILMNRYSRKKEVAFDEAQQTATDYSLEVTNPPTDAYDPEEWRTFFGQIVGDKDLVKVVTVALDNEDFIDVLTKRRQVMSNLAYGLPPGVELKTADRILTTADFEEHVASMPPKPWWKKLLRFSHYEEWMEQMKELDAEIEEMSEKTYEVSNVFVSFETEHAQRAALTALDVRDLDIWRNNVDALRDPDLMTLRGKHVLSCREPPEPSAVRWQDLDESWIRQVITVFLTTLVSFAIVVVGGVLIALGRMRSVFTASIVITIMNTVTPQLVAILTSYESHSTEGAKQTSRYIKMTAMRWVYTVIVTTIITPFTDTLTDGRGHLIPQIRAIFIIEMTRIPLLRLADPFGNLNRHYFGPRQADQRRMNLKFTGSYWQLSERYTEMTKILFLCFWYNMLFPTGFFFAAMALFIQYWTDKFCLLRTWAPQPILGTQISVFSRNYFFTLALLGYALMLAYGYSSFPYDNACDEGTQVSANYIGTYTVTTQDFKTDENVEVNVTISANETNFEFCNQDMLTYKGKSFPPIPRFQPEGDEWMTPEQEQWAYILGWTSVAVLCVVGIIYIKCAILSSIKKIFFKSYKPDGKAMDIKFSAVEEIYGYVPQIKIPGYAFPQLLCFIDPIDRGLVGWRDQYHSDDTHNLILDVPKVAKAVEEWRNNGKSPDDSRVDDLRLFTIIKDWGAKSNNVERHERSLEFSASMR